jgi:hypothetical protein
MDLGTLAEILLAEAPVGSQLPYCPAQAGLRLGARSQV